MSRLARLGNDIVDVVKNSSLGELAFEYAEVALDSASDSEIVKEIPGVSTIRALLSLKSSYSDRMLGRKIEKFVRGIAELKDSERAEMVSRLESDSDYGRSVGMYLVELLDRVDGHKKPEMLARTFAAFARKEIELLMLLRLNVAIERVPNYEIKNIRPFNNDGKTGCPQLDDVSIHAFLSAGLARVRSGYNGSIYEPTEVCSAFVSLELDRTNT
ncbi:MAG: hypothetical protein MUE46_03465 [Xanthomonadales bacterium]|jgi:hypothetical protein|nr:hypothetical protein [Xanthomonadales bacterium]